MKSILNFIAESANELYKNSTYRDEPDVWMIAEKDKGDRYYYIHFFSIKKEAIENLSLATDKAEVLAAKVNKTGDYEQQTIDGNNYIFAKIL